MDSRAFGCPLLAGTGLCLAQQITTGQQPLDGRARIGEAVS